MALVDVAKYLTQYEQEHPDLVKKSQKGRTRSHLAEGQLERSPMPVRLAAFTPCVAGVAWLPHPRNVSSGLRAAQEVPSSTNKGGLSCQAP
ncbi:hypothetical protein QF032_006400 [Streptomyces achromogenes]|uniref:hypothetical protein n=1 Tax=Streptomyces achromogenes TaxID=67255 RepID=UPI00278829A3|nr:hypothetical protein [Streptomyces achromogenes]MDQ0834556.1 hypothetical protein [Streptomyces achromogenes]